MRQASRQHPDGFETLVLFRIPMQLNLFRLIGGDDEHSVKAQDGERVASGMKPLSPAIRQCDQKVLRLDRLARQSTHERGFLWRNVPSLAVPEPVIPTPLQQGNPAQVPLHTEHAQYRLVGEDEPSILVNDSERDTDAV
jgi:hypothetical protein